MLALIMKDAQFHRGAVFSFLVSAPPLLFLVPVANCVLVAAGASRVLRAAAVLAAFTGFWPSPVFAFLA